MTITTHVLFILLSNWKVSVIYYDFVFACIQYEVYAKRNFDEFISR